MWIKTLLLTLLLLAPAAGRAAEWTVSSVAVPWVGEGATACSISTVQGNAGFAILRLANEPGVTLRFWHTKYGLPSVATIGVSFSYDNDTPHSTNIATVHEERYIDFATPAYGGSKFLEYARAGSIGAFVVQIGNPAVTWRFLMAGFLDVQDQWQACVPFASNSDRLQATHEAVDEQLATLVGADWQKTNNDPAFMKWLNVDDPSSNETRSNAMISAYNAGNSAKVARYFNQFRAEQDANSIVVLAQTDIPSRVKAAFWPSEEALPPLIIMGLLGLAFVVVIFKSIPRRISILRPMYWWNCPIARTGYLLRQLLIASFCFVVIILCVFAHDLYLIVIPIFLMFWCGLCSTLNRFQDIGMSRWHVFGILGAALLSAACEHTIQPDGNQGAAAALRVLFGVPGLSYFLILHFRPSAQIGPASRGIHGPEPQTMEHGLSTSGQTG